MGRADVRVALAALLRSALVGVGKPCQLVLEYKPSTLDKAPLVCVISAGSLHPSETVDSVQYVHSFGVVVFVPDSNVENGWTEAMVEDTLDSIEGIIVSTVAANRNTADWLDIGFTGDQSIVEDVTLSDATYATEVHMLNVLVAS